MSRQGPAPRDGRGFTLVEALVAMALLAFFMGSVDSVQGDAIQDILYIMDVSDSAQIMESAVLEIEEVYRVEGFPTNALEGENCNEFLPKVFDDRFECSYDLLVLEVNETNMQAMGADATENINQSPLMKAFCTGGADGMSPVAPEAALASLMANGQALPQGMQAFGALLDPGFQQVCGINLGKMCTNTALITSFIPMIIEQAAQTTRKLVVRVTWDDHFDETMEIETFITAVPEAEEVKP